MLLALLDIGSSVVADTLVLGFA
ncbi:hypothetical protein [Argonema antarcticum]